MDTMEMLVSNVGFTPNCGYAIFQSDGKYVNHDAPLRSVDDVRKAFVYLVSPVCFERDYPNAFLSKVAKHVKLSQSGPLDPVNHSTTDEVLVLLLANEALRMLLILNGSSIPIFLKGRLEEIRIAWKLTDPLYFLAFIWKWFADFCRQWQNQEVLLLLTQIVNDQQLLLFVIALFITYDDRFRDHVFNEVTQFEGRRDEEADRVFQKVLKTKDSGSLRDAIRSIKLDVKLNPFSPELYDKLWSAYSCLGQHEYACWCASRQVWLNFNKGYLNWMNSAEAQGKRQLAIDVGRTLVTIRAHHVSAIDTAFCQEVVQAVVRNEWDDSDREDASAEDGRISLKSSAVLISKTPFGKLKNMRKFLDCSPVPIFHLPMARGVVKTSTGPFLHLYASDDPHYIAFRDNYGCVPLQWITQFSHDKTLAHDGLERAAFHGWFLLSIYPLAFGVNYPHPLLSIWVEALQFFSKIPIEGNEISVVVEPQNIKRIFNVFNLVLFDKELLMMTQSELLMVLEMQDPYTAIEYGKYFLSKAFGSAVSCLDDDRQVCLFLVVLIIGMTDYLCQLALDVSVPTKPSSEVLELRNRAKDAITKKEYSEALKIYRKALSMSPTDSVIFSNIAQVYIDMKHFELAKWFALRAIWLSPNQPKNHYRWCKATALSGNVKAAIAITDAISACLSKSAEVIVDPLWSEIQKLPKELFSIRENNTVKPDNLGKPERHSTIKNRNKIEVIPSTPSSDRQKKTAKMTVNVSSIDQKKCKILSDSSQFHTFIQSGSQHYVNQLFKSASESYAAAIEILSRMSRKDLRLSEMDEVVLKYCFAMSCIRRHTYQDIRKGIEVLKEILQEYRVPFPMAYYGEGYAYIMMNRFMDGIGPLQKALEVVEKMGVRLEAHAFPGLRDKVIDESRHDKLREAVIALLAICGCPLPSDATCHAHDANTISDSDHVSKIYFSDPEFQGYVRMTCRGRCTIEFHPRCYKKFAEEMKIHGDKNVIGHRCITPDCNADFIRLQIFGSDGIVRKTLPEESEAKVKTAKTHVKNKTQIRKEVTKKTFKKRLPTLSSNSADDGDQQTVGRELSNDLESKEEAAFPSCMDTRSAGDALLVLNKKRDKDSSPTVQTSVSKKRSPSECVQTSTINLTYSDRNRIHRLEAEKIAIESDPASFRRISVRTDPPVSNPVQPDNYLRDFEASRQQSVDDRVLMDAIEASSAPTRSTDLERLMTIINFVKQFVSANGPISLSSARFLDFINCFPVELQDLISLHENGISGLLNFCPVLFIGDFVFTRENVLSALSSGSISFVASLDLAAQFRDNSTQARSDLGRVRKCRSVPCFLHLGRHSESGKECGNEKDQSERVENEDQQIGIINKVIIEELTKDLEDMKEKNRLLTEQLQCHRDELFAAQKETELERKAKLEAIGNCAALKLEQKGVKKNYNKITTELRLELKQLRTNYAAEVEKSRSAEDERRKGVILQEEVDDLRRNLVAMEANHSAVMTENRDLKDRLLVLENKHKANKDVIEKMTVRTQEMAVSVDKMAMEMRSHDRSKPLMPNIPVQPSQFLPCGVQYASSMPPVNTPMTAFALQGHNLLYPFRYTLSPSYPLSQFPPPSLPSTVPRFKVPLLPTPKTPATDLNGLEPLAFKNKPNRSLEKLPTTDADQPSSGLDKALSPRASKDDFGKCTLPSIPPESAVRRRSSTFEDCCSEGGRSYDSMANELSLPYSMGTAGRSFPCNDATGSSKCQAEVMFNELRKDFENLTKTQFLTYFQLAKSGANKDELIGLPLKDIIRRVRMTVLWYPPLQTSPVTGFKSSVCGWDSKNQVKQTGPMSVPPIALPSFWSQGPGGGTKSKKSEPKETTSEMEIVSDDVCAICLIEIKAVDAHFMLCPGRHCYHSKCIRQWYSGGHNSCPKCGANVPLQEDFPILGK